MNYRERRDINNGVYCITRIDDGAAIPLDERNRDYQEYLQWVSQGNAPLPDDTPLPSEPLGEVIENGTETAQGSVTVSEDIDTTIEYSPETEQAISDKEKEILRRMAIQELQNEGHF